MATEYLECDKSKLRCTLSTKYKADFIDLILKNNVNISLRMLVLIKYWNIILDMLY